jgi:TolA-binding protein
MYQRSAASGKARSEEILFMAMNDYQVGRYEEASNGLTQFLDRYPRHRRRAVAAVALGNAQLALGRAAEAEPRFRTAAGAAPKGSDLWVAAKMGLGLVAEAQGSFDTAQSEFLEAAEAAASKEAGGEAMVHAIRAKIRASDAAGARTLLEKAEKDYTGTRAARSFSELRGLLDAATPTG